MELLLSVLYLVGVLCLVIAFVLLLTATPSFIYYVVRLSAHARDDAPRDWRTAWGLNYANLFFFPSLLDDRGRDLQAKARKWAIKAFAGVVLGVLSFVLTGEWWAT
jgi:hypothetical protein